MPVGAQASHLKLQVEMIDRDPGEMRRGVSRGSEARWTRVPYRAKMLCLEAEKGTRAKEIGKPKKKTRWLAERKG